MVSGWFECNHDCLACNRFSGPVQGFCPGLLSSPRLYWPFLADAHSGGMERSMEQTTRILVLDGGFAGVFLAAVKSMPSLPAAKRSKKDCCFSLRYLLNRGSVFTEDPLRRGCRLVPPGSGSQVHNIEISYRTRSRCGGASLPIAARCSWCSGAVPLARPRCT